MASLVLITSVPAFAINDAINLLTTAPQTIKEPSIPTAGCNLELSIKAPEVQPKTGHRVTRPAKSEFSSNPTDAEFFEIRVLSQPLIPVGGTTTAAENRDLAAALTAFKKRARNDDYSSLNSFLRSVLGTMIILR
jgi:hypothetical protein